MPASALVEGFVVWKEKLTEAVVERRMVQSIAGMVPVLIMVTNAVAAVPTWTERLLGKTAATREMALADADLSISCRNNSFSPAALRWHLR